MLTLENLAFQTSKSTFNNSQQKYIKFQVDTQLFLHQISATVKSPILIEWKDPVSVPFLPNKEYRFEIYEKHRFGYNPQQLKSVGIGRFSISQQDTFGTWQVTSDKGNKLGFISAKIKRGFKNGLGMFQAGSELQVVAISSIIIHASAFKQKRGFVVITVNGKSFNTEIIKSKSGELLFTETIQIQKGPGITQATIQAFTYDAKEDKSSLVASGTFKLDEEHPQRRIILKTEKETEAGDAFIDYKITSKYNYSASKQFAKIIQHKALLNSSRIEHQGTFSASKTINASRLVRDQLVNQSVKKGQKRSVINHNTKIFIPTEQRFKLYRDRQNHNVSYLQERNSMDFKTEHGAKMYYRGASIGSGQKLDFVKMNQSSPGVGVYKLPSIWDRY